jgi:hypothetical protein
MKDAKEFYFVLQFFSYTRNGSFGMVFEKHGLGILGIKGWTWKKYLFFHLKVIQNTKVCFTQLGQIHWGPFNAILFFFFFETNEN